ncbi:helix-turn-helix transcriptional regulator [Rhodococcus opacus]|nr:helix-turn-helix transcriptional regulator [Rhodococcus opacus]
MGQAPSNTPGPLTIATGTQIRHAMIDANIRTNTELAGKAGVSVPTIGRILKGETSASIETYQAIAKALNIPLSKLITAAEARL